MSVFFCTWFGLYSHRSDVFYEEEIDVIDQLQM